MADVLSLYCGIEASLMEDGPADDFHHTEKVAIVSLVIRSIFGEDALVERLTAELNAYLEVHEDGTTGELR